MSAPVSLIFLIFISATIPFVKMQSENTIDSDSTNEAWAMEAYGQIEDLKLKTLKRPEIINPTELLIKVSASAVNPIDNLMITGYAKNLLRILRFFGNEFPLIVGRDFSGVVIEKGNRVSDDEFKIGDRVYGVVPIQKQGSFSEYLVVDKSYTLIMPDHLNFEEAASIPYGAMTAWSGLQQSGQFRKLKSPNTKVLILGASGGVGNQAVQIVKAEGATVVGTCSADAVPLVRSLGADYVFNYRDSNYTQEVAAIGKYDVIFDCANSGYENIPESWQFSTYITLDAPLVKYTDSYGAIPGVIVSLTSYLRSNISSWMKGKSIQWGFFTPNREGLVYIEKLIKDKKNRPVIQQSFKFSELPEAMKTYAKGHLRGKIVINHSL